MNSSINIDEEIDALYANLGEGTWVDTEEIAEDIYLDLDCNGNVLGVEILNYRNLTLPRIKKLYTHVTKNQRAILEEHFVCEVRYK